MDIKQFMPSRSAIAHLRFVFSLFLFPVFLFALSQTPALHTTHVFLVFFIWHFLVFPSSNGYNSYFDNDKKSIALLEKPPKVDITLYYFSLLLELTALLSSLFINLWFAIAVLIYGVVSKMYSHPSIRLKKYPFISFLTVFFFQGAFFYSASLVFFTKPIPEKKNSSAIIPITIKLVVLPLRCITCKPV